MCRRKKEREKREKRKESAECKKIEEKVAAEENHTRKRDLLREILATAEEFWATRLPKDVRQELGGLERVPNLK